MTARHADTETASFKRREERLFRSGFDWYYHIREGQQGPFATKLAAEEDLAEYLRTLRFIEENADRLPADFDAEEITHIEILPPQY